ncbi:MAG: (d)CMP kinase [Deltaproteobacteria bacterium]
MGIQKKWTIAIDGPAGAGKSTAAQLFAERIGYLYLDTGAIYRCVTWGALKNKIKARNSKKLFNFCKHSRIDFFRKENRQKVYFNHKDITSYIRSAQVTRHVSAYSKLPVVRKALLGHQRRFSKEGGIVAEGRDLGTVVFPKAELKFFLDASLEERAKRRHLEIKKGDLGQVKKEIYRRDRIDSKRELAPLKKAKDALAIDTTLLNVDQVVARMYNEFKERRKKK